MSAARIRSGVRRRELSPISIRRPGGTVTTWFADVEVRAPWQYQHRHD